MEFNMGFKGLNILISQGNAEFSLLRLLPPSLCLIPYNWNKTCGPHHKTTKVSIIT